MSMERMERHSWPRGAWYNREAHVSWKAVGLEEVRRASLVLRL
jgi:hypothetical protein